MQPIASNCLQKHLDLATLIRARVLRLLKNVNDGYEEERRKVKCQVDLTEKISVCEDQLSTLAVEEAKVLEDKKKVQQKSLELHAKLKRELCKSDDMQSKLNSERTRIEEQERIAKNLQDKANLYLKPYQEYLGVTFQISSGSEASLRILFHVNSNKKCVVKLTKHGLKIVKCVPMLEGLDKIEARLHTTNDYPGFLTHLRSLFMKSITHS